MHWNINEHDSEIEHATAVLQNLVSRDLGIAAVHVCLNNITYTDTQMLNLFLTKLKNCAL